MSNAEERYWEDYDDQDGSGFTEIGYTNLAGKLILVPISGDLAEQVAEIRRCNGNSTSVRLYQ